MTEHPTSPRIDPRFDPRFQRGYAPDAAALAPDQTPTPDGAARAPDAAASAPVQTPRNERLNPAARVSGFGDSADTPQASVATRGDAAASPNPATRGGRVVGGDAGGGVVDVALTDTEGFEGGVDVPLTDTVALEGGVAAGAPTHAAPPDAARAESALAAEPAPHTSATRWFWMALGACAAFIVLGATLFWSQASDPSYFMGGRPGFTQTFQQFVMILSPSLVQAGVIGIVAVLVGWALRGRHDSRGREGRGRQ